MGVRALRCSRTVGRVRLLRIVPERYRSLVRELVTFGFAGAVNTGLGFLIFNWLLSAGTLVLTANAIATACATGTSFVLNRYVTYRHRPRTSLRRELPLFVFFNLIGLGLQQLIMASGKWIFGLSEADRLELNLIRVGAVAVGTVFLLLTYRTFVFKKAPEMAIDLAPEVVVAEDLADAVAIGHAQDGSAEFDELTDPLEAEYALGEMLEGELRNRTTEEIDSPAMRSSR
jgi:putative flippase GtrA